MRSAGARTLLVTCLFAFALSGCATTRPSLSPVPPSELPGVWLRELRALPQPGPFRADFRARVDDGSRPAFTLSGSIQSILPDTLRLEAQGGINTPVLALRARADSCQLLLHRDAAYWDAPRSPIDWALGGPSALARGLSWALAPQEILERFIPDGAGEMAAGRWVVWGRLDRGEGPAGRVRCEVDPKGRRIRRVTLDAGPDGALDLLLDGYTELAGGWSPTRLDLRFGAGVARVQMEILQVRSLPRDELGSLEFLHPPRWSRVAPGARLFR